MDKRGRFLVLRKPLLVYFCVLLWLLFSDFSISCMSSFWGLHLSATPTNYDKGTLCGFL